MGLCVAAGPSGGGYLMGLHVAARSTNTNVKYYVCSLETRCTRSEIKKQYPTVLFRHYGIFVR